jgi:hypothetical protein
VVLLEKVKGVPPQTGKILGGVFRSGGAVIFEQDDVECPVQAVLDAPMPANSLAESFGIEWETGQVEAAFDGILYL